MSIFETIFANNYQEVILLGIGVSALAASVVVAQLLRVTSMFDGLDKLKRDGNLL